MTKMTTAQAAQAMSNAVSKAMPTVAIIIGIVIFVFIVGGYLVARLTNNTENIESLRKAFEGGSFFVYLIMGCLFPILFIPIAFMIISDNDKGK